MKTKDSLFKLRTRRRGMTLIELTVVIAVLLALVGILFMGARIYKRGSDRARCIVNIRAVQVGVRSFANLNQYIPGQDTSPVDLENSVVGNGSFVDPMPTCPGDGTYEMGGNTVPLIGELYLTCSLEDSQDHVPQKHDDW